MKILLAGFGQYPPFAPAMAQALRMIGHEVEFFDLSHRYIPGILGRAEQHFSLPTWSRRIHSRLLAEAKRVSPDVVLLHNANMLGPHSVKELAKLAWVSGYQHDDPFGLFGQSRAFARFRQAIPYYDSHHVIREKNLEDYAALDTANVRLLRTYYVPWLHQPTPRSIKNLDVVFVGHAEEDSRLGHIRYLIEDNVRLNIFGPTKYWTIYLGSESASRLALRGPVYGLDYAATLNQAKICLAFYSESNRDSYSYRVFEIPACGGFLLGKRTALVQELYQEGSEAEFFDSSEELAEKIRFYLTHDEERERIALKGYQRCTTSGYDVVSRVKQWTADTEEWRGLSEPAQTPYSLAVPRQLKTDPPSPSLGTKTKVAILWSELAGYSLACFEALAQKPGVEVLVIHWPPRLFPMSVDPQAAALRLLNKELLPGELLGEEVTAFRPDVLVISGWMDSGYLNVARRFKRQGVPVVGCMDNRWRGTLKQQLGRFIAPFTLQRNFDFLWVPGSGAAELARRLGYAGDKLLSGLYACNVRAMTAVADDRLASTEGEEGWPRRFLFVGQYLPYKGLDVLVEAYQRYRENCAEPWDLWCAGGGRLKPLLQDKPGIVDLGFVQPSEIPGVFRQVGAFVLPSRSEAWGVALQEAMCSGLAVLCSRECGASLDLVKEGVNGHAFKAGDAGHLALLLEMISSKESSQLQDMGLRGKEIAQAISPETWAETVLGLENRGHERPHDDPATGLAD